MLIKQKSPSLPRSMALGTFCELPVVSSTKVNLVYLLYSMAQVLSSAPDKAELFAKNFSKNSNLVAQISLYLFSLLELIWNCIIFL